MFRECCDRVNRLIWNQVERMTSFGIDVILEGWGTRDLRDEARRELSRIGLRYQFLLVECPSDIRLERIKERNDNLAGEGGYISGESFNRMEKLKEEFDEDEEFRLIDNSEHKPCAASTQECAERKINHRLPGLEICVIREIWGQSLPRGEDFVRL